MSSFCCPHYVDGDDSCRRVKTDCIPGRPGCVLQQNSTFAVPAEERLGSMENDDLRTCKRRLRVKSISDRNVQEDKPALSTSIQQRLIGLPEFRRAQTVSVYVSTKTEVRTHEFIKRSLEENRRIAVPCCLENELQLFRLDSLDDLAPRTMGILEPRDEFQQSADRWLSVSQVDLFVVPGIAFDPNGGRLGYGKGYYDRLLAKTLPAARKIGLAFECQMFDRVPMGPNDVFMDAVITEQALYRCRGE